MALAAPFGFALCMALALALGIVLLVRTPTPHATPDAATHQLLESARRRGLIAVLTSVALAVILFAIGVNAGDLLGLPILLAPAVGTAAGLLLYTATPPRVLPVGEQEVREASIAPRTTLSFVPRGAILALAAIALVQLALLAFTGPTASPDASGRSRQLTFETAMMTTTASPYPGWYYAIPLLIATVVLVGACALALRRVSATPALPYRGLAVLDTGWRRVSNRLILTLCSGALLFQFSMTAGIAGASISTAYRPGVPVWWLALGITLVICGILALLASLTAAILAIVLAGMLPARVRNGSLRGADAEQDRGSAVAVGASGEGAAR